MEPINSQSSDAERELELKKAKLLAALNGKPLAPEITSDETDENPVVDTSREAEFRANKPPHHE